MDKWNIVRIWLLALVVTVALTAANKPKKAKPVVKAPVKKDQPICASDLARLK